MDDDYIKAFHSIDLDALVVYSVTILRNEKFKQQFTIQVISFDQIEEIANTWKDRNVYDIE